MEGLGSLARFHLTGGEAGDSPQALPLLGDLQPDWLSADKAHDIALNDLVAQAHMRWRIERDYQDLKQELGLGHYEGRGWRGFHHHAALSIAAYGFLVTERIAAGKPAGAKKTSPSAKFLRFPRITSLVAAQRHVSDSITTIRYQLSFQLIERLGQCPCCGRQDVRRRV